MLDSPLPQPADPVDADATRRAFLKKVAVGGAAVAVGTQLMPLRAFAQDGGSGDGGSGDGGSGDGGTGDASEDGTGESPGGEESPDTTAPGTEQESEEPELTPDEQRIDFLAGIALAGATVYRAAAGDEDTGDEEDEEEAAAETTETTTTLPPITVPPLAEPVVEVLRVFGSHHSQQAAGLNGMLTNAVVAPNATLVAEVRSALGTAADEAAVLGLLRDLEERIAATHLQALADLEDANDATLVARALPIAGQHATVLGLIGSTPAPLEELVPEEQTTDGAFDEAAYPSEPATEDVPGSDTSEEPEGSAGGEGADPDTGTEQNPEDGTEQSGGGADGGSSTDAGGSANDPESEG